MTMRDQYRVIPHRDILVTSAGYEHKPCGMDLSEGDVKEANWCPHCAAIINKAARRRAEQHRSAASAAQFNIKR